MVLLLWYILSVGPVHYFLEVTAASRNTRYNVGQFYTPLVCAGEFAGMKETLGDYIGWWDSLAADTYRQSRIKQAE